MLLSFFVPIIILWKFACNQLFVLLWCAGYYLKCRLYTTNTCIIQKIVFRFTISRFIVLESINNNTFHLWWNVCLIMFCLYFDVRTLFYRVRCFWFFCKIFIKSRFLRSYKLRSVVNFYCILIEAVY